jgi:predicted enzyme related to lactoylglutathione lyase
MKEGAKVINWFEIPVNDFQRAKNFYETIFDISMAERDMGDAKMGFFPNFGNVAHTGGAICKGAGYLVCHKGPKIYLNANPDMLKILDRVYSAGGEVLVPREEITPEIGYMAVIKDTEGNHIYLHSDE